MADKLSQSSSSDYGLTDNNFHSPVKNQKLQQRFVIEEIEEQKTEVMNSSIGVQEKEEQNTDYQQAGGEKIEQRHANTSQSSTDSGGLNTGNKEPSFQEDFAPPASQKSMRRILLIAITVLILGGIVGLVFWAFGKIAKSENKKEAVVSELPATSTPTPSPTLTPTPTPAEKIDFSSYKVRILNGTGVHGEAGRIASLFKEAGFGAASAANASSFNHTKTTVQMKKNIPDTVFEKVKELLSDREVVKEENLPDDSSYDIVITIGSTASSTDVSGE